MQLLTLALIASLSAVSQLFREEPRPSPHGVRLFARHEHHNHAHGEDHDHDHDHGPGTEGLHDLHDPSEAHSFEHGHEHFTYRNNTGDFAIKRNYIGAGVVFVGGAAGSALGLGLGLGATFAATTRSFTTGVLLAMVFCQILIASTIVMQERPLPEDLAHISFAPGCTMAASFFAHLLDYAYPKKQAQTTALLVFAALLIHACNFGISLGMKREASVGYLIGAAFKLLLCGLALGTVIVDAGYAFLAAAALAVLFAAACPVTAVVGTLLKDMPRNIPHIVIEGISEALAAGLLVYVVLVTLLSRKFSKDYAAPSPSHKAGSLFCLYAGVIAIAVVTIWCK